MKQQRSILEKRNALEEGKSRDAVGRPSWRSSLLSDPGAKFLGGKLESFTKFREYLSQSR